MSENLKADIQAVMGLVRDYAGNDVNDAWYRLISALGYTFSDKGELICAPQAGEQKPVAWRSRQRDMAFTGKPGPWNYWDSPEVAPVSDHVYEAEPLFAHPPKTDPDVVRLVEAAREVGQTMACMDGEDRVAKEALWESLAPFSALGEG